MPEAEKNVDENEAKIRKSFDAGIAGKMTEDQIKMAMIKAGASFKNVTRLYNQFAQDAGLITSKEEREKLIDENCKDKNLADEGVYTEVIDRLVGLIKGTNESAIVRAVNKWAESNKVEVFKKPKGTGGGRSGFREDFYAALRQNPNMSKDELDTLIKEKGSDNVKRQATYYHGVRELVNSIAEGKKQAA
jgi:hypothetical protein